MSWPGQAVEEVELPMTAATAAATLTARIDTRGYDYAIVRIPFDTWATTEGGTCTCSLLHSDDTVVTNFATVVANRTHQPTAAASLVSYRVDLRGKKRYLRVTCTAGTHTNDAIITAGVDYSLFRPDEAPSSTTDMTVNSADVAVVVP